MKRPAWLAARERGSLLGMRLFVWTASFMGRRAARGLLALVIGYYAVVHGSARRASSRYLARVGVGHGFGDVYRHLLRFGQCTLDRLFFARGETDRFEVHHHGEEHLRALKEEGRGALLLSAHIGSFEAMRVKSVVRDIPVNVVVNSANARMLRRVLKSAGGEGSFRILELSDSPLDTVFRVQELIEAGELVALMADRAVAEEDQIEVDFLGAKAPFPASVYALAAVLRCPVYITVGIYRGGNRYDLYCEPFAEKVDLPRRDRRGATAVYAQKYAERLEHYCRIAPDNWFNFFDFWVAP